MTVDQQLDSSTVEEYLSRMEDVPGWFGFDDAEAFLTICAVQTRLGVDGDMLEVGSFWGRSAILLGHATSADERLTVCDIFEQVPTATVAEELSALTEFRQPSRADFEATYRQFHPGLPEIVQGDSSMLGAAVAHRSFRFVHIDGSHVYSSARADLELATAHLASGGVIAADDYANSNFPGVAGAVWELVWSGRLVPLFGTPSKLYLTSPETSVAAQIAMRTELAARYRSVREHVIAGVTVGVGKRAHLSEELLGRQGQWSRRRRALRRRSALLRAALTR